MTTFRPDTSFPYLKIARDHGVDYARVLQFSDMVDKPQLCASDCDNAWKIAVCLASLNERNRRLALSSQQDQTP